MEKQYSIRETSHLTGVQPVTLRAWERRYGLLRPARTPRGHRVYGETDLRRINDIVYWVDQGVAISKVASVLASPTGGGETGSGERADAVEATLRALDDGNVRRLEKVLSTELSLYPLAAFVDSYVEPVRHQLRQASASPVARGQLALFESVAQQKLAVRLLNLTPRRGRAGVLVAALGETARLDLVLLALAVGQHQSVWCELEQADVEATLALALSMKASAVLFCLAPSLSSTGLERLVGKRARQYGLDVYACSPGGPHFHVMPAGVVWLDGGLAEVAGRVAEPGDKSS